MFCKFCGEKLEDNALFCPKCGKNQNTDDDAAPEVNVAQAENSSPKAISPKTKKIIDICFLCAYIIGTVGVVLFLGIVIVGLAAYGTIYLFDGYSFTKVLSIMSIVFMLIGFCAVAVKILLSLIFKITEFPKSIIKIVLLSTLALACLGLSIWGFVDYGNTKENSSGTYTEPINFYLIYSECSCESPWAKAGVDYLSIDTNPYDYENETLAAIYASKALAAIRNVNSKLRIPSYVYEEMLSTRAVDGRQSYVGSRVSVSWRYHPSSGLEVIYTI